MKIEIKKNKLVIFLGDKTLIIYYVHLFFLILIVTNVIKKYVILSFSLSNLVIYGILLSIIIYVFSLIVAIMFKLLLKIFKKIKL